MRSSSSMIEEAVGKHSFQTDIATKLTDVTIKQTNVTVKQQTQQMELLHTTYLGLGCNLGNREETMCEAIQQIGKRIGAVMRQSAFIETEPWGFDSLNLFLNACICVETALSPQELLEETQAIERELGRTCKSTGGHYADRTIDIDILLYDRLTLSLPTLTVPHPHIAERDFVLRPLREICPPALIEFATNMTSTDTQKHHNNQHP